MNFKVGDFVRVKTLKEFSNEKYVVVTENTSGDDVLCYECSYNFSFLVKMKKYCGKTYQVVAVNERSNYYRLLEIYNQENTDDLTINSASVYHYVFQDWMLVPAQKTLIVKTDGMKRTSVYQGSKQATVSLWHEDNYDEFVGAVEALAKFYSRKSPFDELKYYKEAYEDVAQTAAQLYEEQPEIKPYILISDKAKTSNKKVCSPRFKKGDRFRLSCTSLPGSTILPYKFYFLESAYEQLKGHIFTVDHVSNAYCSYDGVTREYQDLYFKIDNTLCTYPSFLFTEVYQDNDSDEYVHFVEVPKYFDENKQLRKLCNKRLRVKKVKGDSIIVNGPKNKPYAIPKSKSVEAYVAQEEDHPYSKYKLGDRICLLTDSNIARKYSKGTIIGYGDNNSFKVRFDSNFKAKARVLRVTRLTETLDSRDFRLE